MAQTWQEAGHSVAINAQSGKKNVMRSISNIVQFNFENIYTWYFILNPEFFLVVF